MSIRSEIRAALVDGPKTTDELLPLVPGAENDRERLSASMSVLATSQMIRRTGLADDGKPIYQLDPRAWPARDTDDPPPPSPEKGAQSTAAKKASPPKAQRPPADPARTAAKKPAAKTRARQPTAALRSGPVHRAGWSRKPRTPAMPTTRAIAALPAAAEPLHHVGMQLDGSVIVFTPGSGAHQHIDAAIVRQILGMATLLRPAASTPAP